MQTRTKIAELEALRGQRHVCFAEQLRSATRAITSAYNAHLSDCGIGISQLSLMIRLYYYDDITVTRLARLLETERSTLSRNVQTLERAGYAEVWIGEDQRERRVRLTGEGRKILAAAVPHWLEAQAQLRDLIGSGQWNALFSGMRELAELDGFGTTDSDAKTGPDARPRSLRR